jgi:hypothetical protein
MWAHCSPPQFRTLQSQSARCDWPAACRLRLSNTSPEHSERSAGPASVDALREARASLAPPPGSLRPVRLPCLALSLPCLAFHVVVLANALRFARFGFRNLRFLATACLHVCCKRCRARRSCRTRPAPPPDPRNVGEANALTSTSSLDPSVSKKCLRPAAGRGPSPHHHHLRRECVASPDLHLQSCARPADPAESFPLPPLLRPATDREAASTELMEPDLTADMHLLRSESGNPRLTSRRMVVPFSCGHTQAL